MVSPSQCTCIRIPKQDTFPGSIIYMFVNFPTPDSGHLTNQDTPNGVLIRGAPVPGYTEWVATLPTQVYMYFRQPLCGDNVHVHCTCMIHMYTYIIRVSVSGRGERMYGWMGGRGGAVEECFPVGHTLSGFC